MNARRGAQSRDVIEVSPSLEVRSYDVRRDRAERRAGEEHGAREPEEPRT